MDFTKLTGEALTAALDINVATASDAALAAALVPRTEALTALFAAEPTAEVADAAEAITASKQAVEAEIAERAEKIKASAAKIEAAKQAFADAEAKKDEEKPEFSDDSEVEAADESDEEDEDDESEADEDDEDDEDDEADDAAEGEGDGEAVTTAAAKRAPTTTKPRSTKAAVARKNKRPAVQAANPVTITAGANIDGFSLGQKLDGMNEVAKATMATAKAFPKFNARSGAAVNSQTGGVPQITKHNVAKFAVDFEDRHVGDDNRGQGNEHNAIRTAIKDHKERLALSMKGDGLSAEALTAAAWCAPSPVVYSWIADYVVDGLLTLPEVSAPRGGLNTTTGPRVGGESQGDTNLDAFGWIQTEAQADANTVKPFEVIECPEFEDHRLDAIGYAFTIPILTQKAFPELVTDTLRFADVLYAHKVNRRLIEDLIALSDPVTFDGYGPSFTDSLEAFSLLAVKERRKWNLGVNAILEVKLPEWVREVFRADMSRRNNAPLDDPINDQRIMAHFASRRLSVEFIADFQELTGTNIVLPGSFDAIIYPAGAVVKAVEDVVNLSAIYDAASLSVNNYTGVFFEQGIMTFLAGYSVSRVTVPVNTAGEAGALSLTGLGDAIAAGSF